MNKITLLLPGLLLVLALPLPASGRVQDGFDVEIESLAAPARGGEEFTARLRVLCDRPLQLTDFSLSGDQWSNLTWTPVRGATLAPGTPLVVAISGKPSRGDAPLTVIIRSDSKALRRVLTLGGEDHERRTGALPTRLVDKAPPSSWVSPRVADFPVQPARPHLDSAGDGSSGDQEGEVLPEKADRDRNIRIRGRFIYVRDGTTVMGADGMTVHVYDDDPLADDHLGSGVTNSHGDFDFTVHWESQVGESDPDLLLVLVTENSEVQLRPVGSLYPYRFEFGPWNNYSGSDFDLGVGIPAHEDDNDIPHLITNYTRFWRYLALNGHDTRFLEVRWPGDEDDGAYYNSVSETVQLANSDRWESGTQAHEFGHHIMHCLSSIPDFDYCNGVCDDNEPWDCGHCLWCEEGQSVAWSEGWADYTGHTIPRTFAALYGFPCLNPVDLGSVDTCQEDSQWDDPLITEGFTGAVLADIEDGSGDADPHFPGYDDRLELGDGALLDVLDSDHAQTTTAFLRDLKEHFPDHRENLWWTAMNNGFDIDEEDPDPVFPIICTTHIVETPTAYPTLTFTWQKPDDDASGVRGYGTYLSNSGHAVDPGPYLDLEGETTTITYSNQAPGTYHFSIRTRDWAGNWDDTFTSLGPFIITAPEPRNLVLETPTGWGYHVVPSNSTGATLTSCPLPATLDGMQPTYWNAAARNEGDLHTVADTYTSLEVDGEVEDTFNWGNLPPWCPFVVMNNGPELVVGGLHTITASLDPGHLISETDEDDNKIGKQFAWRPPVLDPETVYSNGLGVPDATGGWETIGATWLFYNSYGLGFSASGWWNALVLWSDNEAVDYDLRLHEVNESPLGGFLFAAEVSSQPAGWADAVLVNRNTMGLANWDAAVLNHHNHSGSHRMQHVRSVEVAYGDSLTETMGTDRYVLLREFEVDYLQVGGISLDLWTDPPQANVSFSWRDADFTTGELMEADALALTGADGHAHLEVAALEPGYTCLMICRQPQDGDEDLQVSYRIRPTLPDLTPATVAGWYAPIVPRPDVAGSPTSVPLPTVLHGDQELTWFNYAVHNASTGTAWGAMRFHVLIDEDFRSFSRLHLFDIYGGETKVFNDDGPRLMNSGRHTVVLDLDRYDYMAELDEANNTFGEQFIWTPPELASGSRVSRSRPPDMVGGWGDITAAAPIYYNCDGLRSATTSAYWRAIAVMPGLESDVDLRLHEAGTGVKTGFGSNLTRSSWGTGQSDYVLVNFNLTGNRAFDAGVLALAGTDGYAAEVVNEYWLGTGATTHGPVTMAAGEILDVYEVRLPVGNWRVTLANDSGNVDWGLLLHPGDQPYLNKSDVLGDAAAWLAPGGAGEQVTVAITEEDYYAFTVWKVGAADLEQSGTYTLTVAEGGASPVGDAGMPLVTRVSGVYPNPFNPRTTVQFDLAEPGEVVLAVYDVTGRRVATLARENYPAGRHQLVWQGRDEAGRPVASGMYVVRLQAGGTTQLKKVMLLK